MCFRCDSCGKVRWKPVIVATRLRAKTYPARTYVHKGEKVEDNGGQGLETAESGRYCIHCAPGMPRA